MPSSCANFFSRYVSGLAVEVTSLRPGVAKAGAGSHARDREMRRYDGACWALDISRARTLVASLAVGNRPAGWVERLLRETRIVEANANAVHLFGAYAGRDRMLGQPILAYWPAEGSFILADLLISAIITGSSTLRIRSLVLRDPKLTAWLSDDESQSDTLFLAILANPVDDRSFWSLRSSEERYNNLIHHLPFAFLEVDSRAQDERFDQLRRDGQTDISAYLAERPDDILEARKIVRITNVNQSAVTLFGARDADQLIGPVDPLFAASPDSARRVMEHHFAGDRRHSEIMKLRTFDGRLLDVSLSVIYPTRPEQLDITLIMLEDITERLRTEAQLRQLQTDFSRAARISMLGELTSSIAHEVNQPLSAILTYAETSLRWLSRDEPNLEKVTELTTRISDSARHAGEIVQRIRGMTARHVPRMALVDLNDIVDEALLFVRHEIEARSIGLSVRLRRDLPWVFGDRVQLQQVVVNLLVNGIQAIQQKHASAGAIELSTDLDDHDAVTFTIRDNGPGIAEEDFNRVFNSFFTTKEEGMGIGLAICQSIIAAHGGAIGASNLPEGGARFWFSLPAGR